MAWQAHWVDDEDLWLDVLEARHKTTHTYKEKTAREVYSALPRFLPALDGLARNMQSRLQGL